VTNNVANTYWFHLSTEGWPGWVGLTNTILNTEWSVHVIVPPDEAMASVYLDNKLVKQTDWKPISQQCWDLKFSLDLDRVCFFVLIRLSSSGLSVHLAYSS